MSYTAVIKKMAADLRLPLRKTGMAVKHMLGLVISELEAGRRVSIRYCGSFRTRLTAARTMKLPGKDIEKFVPSHYSVHFSQNKKLKNILNRNRTAS
jgi:nucleoid DNA-binding protein